MFPVLFTEKEAKLIVEVLLVQKNFAFAAWAAILLETVDVSDVVADNIICVSMVTNHGFQSHVPVLIHIPGICRSKQLITKLVVEDSFSLI